MMLKRNPSRTEARDQGLQKTARKHRHINSILRSETVTNHLSVMEADLAIHTGLLMKRGEDKEKDPQDAGDHRCPSSCMPDSRLLANGCKHLVHSAAPCPLPGLGSRH